MRLGAAGIYDAYAYPSNRGLLDTIGTAIGAATKAAFDYDHDALGRRINVVQTGEMFARY